MLERPYKRIFAEIEKAASSPIASYTYFRNTTAEHGLDPIFYTPMAITSGGFSKDTSLSYGEVVERNTRYAEVVGENLIRTIPGTTSEDFLIPSELGKVKGWGQADYLMFFMHSIAGLDSREAGIVEANIGLSEVSQMPGFTEPALSWQDKWQQGYRHIPERYAAIIRERGLAKGTNGADKPKNIQANILILDPRVSLGTNAERYFGDLLGIGEHVVAIDDPSDELIIYRRELQDLGADPAILTAKNQISGRQNQTNSLQLRSEGYQFRKPGVLTTICEKKDRRMSKPQWMLESARTSGENWAEYEMR